LGGVLQRMGDVLGPGAIYSLVHYGALEEGLLLAAASPGAGTDSAQLVAGLLGVEVKVESDKDKLVRLRIKQAPHFSLENRASVALVVGLLEGAFTTARRRKMQATTDPTMGADGTLKLDLEG
jgi:hypothetical protein